MVGPMADPPAFNPCAYELPVSLWRLIEQFAPEHERQELKQILGESMVDQSLELQEEVDTLLEIWRDYRCETYTESYQKRLPEPPQVRDRLKQEIKFFVENIRERANRQGVDPEKIFASHNKDVLTYALENADKPSTPSRPSTAVSRQGRETPMVISPASDRASLASTVSEEVECMNDKLNILEVDEVIQHLRSTLEEEVAQLVSDINFLQGCLDDEANFRAESSGNDFTEPSITALREERASLEKDLLKGDVPLPPTNKPALPPQLRKYTPLPKGTCGRQSENANISNVPSKLSPVKGNHELSPPSGCGGHEGKDASVRIKVAHPSARAHVVRITAVSDTDSVSDSGQMIPTPPLSSKPKHSRPGSADRFRKMVLQSRDEP